MEPIKETKTEIDILVTDVVVKVIKTTTYNKADYIAMIQQRLADTQAQKEEYIHSQEGIISELQKQLDDLLNK